MSYETRKMTNYCNHGPVLQLRIRLVSYEKIPRAHTLYLFIYTFTNSEINSTVKA